MLNLSLRRFTALAALCLAFTHASADQPPVSGNLQAEKLEDQNGNAILATSLFLLVADTANPGNPASVNFTINTSLTGGLSTSVGTVLAPNQIIVARGDLSSGGPGYFSTPYQYDLLDPVFNGALAVGDRLALLWFPAMTINTTTLIAGTRFGFYDGGVATAANQADSSFSAPDGGSQWLIPTPGFGNNLSYLNKDTTVITTASNASNAAVSGRATGLISIPEPASALLLATGGFALLGRRRSRA